MDLVAPGNARKPVMAAMTDAGMVPEERFNARQGHRRQIWWTPDGASHVDIFLGRFEMCHRLDLDGRLGVDHPALPAADLLLTKLQIVELTQKDVTDTAMLLRTHTLSDHDEPGQLNVDRLTQVLSDDWCWYTTVTDNLEELPAVIDRTVAGRAHPFKVSRRSCWRPCRRPRSHAHSGSALGSDAGSVGTSCPRRPSTRRTNPEESNADPHRAWSDRARPARPDEHA